MSIRAKSEFACVDVNLFLFLMIFTLTLIISLTVKELLKAYEKMFCGCMHERLCCHHSLFISQSLTNCKLFFRARSNITALFSYSETKVDVYVIVVGVAHETVRFSDLHERRRERQQLSRKVPA